MKKYHHGDLAEAMLDLGVKALDEGKQIPPMRQLAKALGVSSGAPYRHFRSRADYLGRLSVYRDFTWAQIGGL